MTGPKKHWNYFMRSLKVRKFIIGKIAFLSGFAIDAHLGCLAKNHKDVDIMISKDEAKELAKYLTNLGHSVYEVEKYKGEILKVDQADPEKETQAHCDIHFFWEENGKVIIPLSGKKLIFSNVFDEITEELSFLGENIKVLKPQYLKEEKQGWIDQIGLIPSEERMKEYDADMDKISALMK